MKIELINSGNIEEVYNFEKDNKDFFEKGLPPRPSECFQYETFREIAKGFIQEQFRGECYMYLIRDDSGMMVGRINLHSIKKGNEKVAELGYRIGQDFQGRGIASKAVELVLEEGFEKHGLLKIEAGTSTINIGSQRVLEKNGFKRVAEEKKVMKVNDKWLNGYLYERHKMIQYN